MTCAPMILLIQNNHFEYLILLFSNEQSFTSKNVRMYNYTNYAGLILRRCESNPKFLEELNNWV